MARPRAYDDGELRQKVMEVFWSLGYERTSIENVVEKSGVNRGSLYAAFPDKRALFMSSLKQYADTVVSGHIEKLRDTQPASRAIREFFVGAVEVPEDRFKRGCLLVNTAVEVGSSDSEVASYVREVFGRVEAVVHERLKEAARDGDLPKEQDTYALARLLMSTLQGGRVLARVGGTREQVRAAMYAALSALPQSPPRKAGVSTAAKSRKRSRVK